MSLFEPYDYNAFRKYYNEKRLEGLDDNQIAKRFGIPAQLLNELLNPSDPAEFYNRTWPMHGKPDKILLFEGNIIKRIGKWNTEFQEYVRLINPFLNVIEVAAENCENTEFVIKLCHDISQVFEVEYTMLDGSVFIGKNYIPDLRIGTSGCECYISIDPESSERYGDIELSITYADMSTIAYSDIYITLDENEEKQYEFAPVSFSPSALRSSIQSFKVYMPFVKPGFVELPTE